MTNQETELKKAIYQDKAAMLYGNSVVSVLITLCSSSALVFGFENPEAQKFKTIWWAIMVTLLFCRSVDAIYWHKKKQCQNYDGRKATYRYIAGTFATALMWCLYSLYILEHSDIIELASNIIIVSAMAGGGATLLAANKYASVGYTFIILIPASLALTLSYEDYKFLLGILGLGFGGVLILTSNRSADFTRQALKFKNENEVLVHQMEEQVEQRTEKIFKLSNLDPLTGLLNRTAFLKQLSQQIDSCSALKQKLAVLFIDLDGFKKVNDSIGHEAGDKVLEKTAGRLIKTCPDGGIICRWGGDEFIMALSNTDRVTAMDISKAVIEELSKTHKLKDNRLTIGACIGIAMFPEHSLSSSMLIRLADTAMYHQKKLSPSKAFIFSEQLGNKVSREHRLKAGLSQAIIKKQLRLVFQPIVYSSNKKTCAFEALLRWKFGWEHIQPSEFIGFAEQYGMIKEIGTWVLNEACRIANCWNKERKILVNVNVSVIQLQDDDFITTVEHALRSNQLAPELLNIEITESIIISDEQVIVNINKLQSIGVKVSVDDFGTGYSSLSAIQNLNVNIVKIDRSFVDSIDTNGLSIIKAIMSISNSLNYSVVGEGVETHEQAEKLTALGVHCLQGFYISKPMEYDQIEGFLEQEKSQSDMI